MQQTSATRKQKSLTSTMILESHTIVYSDCTSTTAVSLNSLSNDTLGTKMQQQQKEQNYGD